MREFSQAAIIILPIVVFFTASNTTAVWILKHKVKQLEEQKIQPEKTYPLGLPKVVMET